MIVKKLLDPSRPDAVRLTRSEKMAFLHLMYAVTIFEDVAEDLPGRLGMIENGKERMLEIAKVADRILYELRITAPENQRIALQNVAKDYEIRLTPRATPSDSNVIMTKEEFRELVDASRAMCKECAYDDEECEGCKLYQLLTSILPLEDYHERLLCPYNLGKWAN